MLDRDPSRGGCTTLKYNRFNQYRWLVTTDGRPHRAGHTQQAVCSSLFERNSPRDVCISCISVCASASTVGAMSGVLMIRPLPGPPWGGRVMLLLCCCCNFGAHGGATRQGEYHNQYRWLVTTDGRPHRAGHTQQAVCSSLFERNSPRDASAISTGCILVRRVVQP